ncbi:hypothetical protein NBG4_290021 [Candidatus Sulfobium mesophilum]|uniref:Uncharacterized protein n=1 Tax=Candidatus Sulfobium mesophilum TaxID=2016548 RepID=A0A2U3QGP7_9BACT|nr:hypothetical protein NBG4_290021 [Candidatus Sulfobium mesophilum]
MRASWKKAVAKDPEAQLTWGDSLSGEIPESTAPNESMGSGMASGRKTHCEKKLSPAQGSFLKAARY